MLCVCRRRWSSFFYNNKKCCSNLFWHPTILSYFFELGGPPKIPCRHKASVDVSGDKLRWKAFRWLHSLLPRVGHNASKFGAPASPSDRVRPVQPGGGREPRIIVAYITWVSLFVYFWNTVPPVSPCKHFWSCAWIPKSEDCSRARFWSRPFGVEPRRRPRQSARLVVQKR